MYYLPVFLYTRTKVSPDFRLLGFSRSYQQLRALEVQDRKRKLSHISSSLSSGYVQSYGALAKKKAGFTDHYSTIFMTHGLSGEQESCNICNQPVRVCCLWPDGDPLAFEV
jgi:hypothetical protein